MKAPSAQFEKLRQLARAFGIGLKPPPNLNIAEWSDMYRQLPRKSSSEYGKWRTSRFPFHEEIMIELSPQSKAQEVSVMKGSQVGCTELSINRILYNMHYNPLPHLYIQKTVEAVTRFSKQRLGPSIDVMPVIKNKLGTARGKDASDTLLIKSYPGGIFIMGGANSAASLRSMPIGAVDLDEWDSFESDIDEEGDPAELALRRTANFPRRKNFFLSSPGLKETSKIEPKFLSGDQRWYNVPCPHCKAMAPVLWKNIKWENNDPTTAHLLCESCGTLIEEKYKTWMFAKINGARWIKNNPYGDHPSFHLSALYSPLGFYSWAEAVKLFLKATKTNDRELLKVFVNTVLGETFSEATQSLSANQFIARCEQYSPQSIPEEALVILAGADVQANRIEVEVIAFGKGQENWSIDYKIIMGDTEQDDVWMQLDGILNSVYRREDGRQMNIVMSMIDSGFRANKVYKFCKFREHRMVYPIKGVSGWGKGLVVRPKNKIDAGVYLFQVYTDEMKTKLYSQLELNVAGPRYCHFPRNDVYNENYFKMLTAEHLETRIERGSRKLEWKLTKGRRNEALDCRVYAMTALQILNPDFDAIEATGGLLVRQEGLAQQQRSASPRMVSAGVS